MCVCVCSACVRVHMRLHTNTRLWLHIQARVSACACVCACVCACMPVRACDFLYCLSVHVCACWQGQLELLGWRGAGTAEEPSPVCSTTHLTLFLVTLDNPGASI